MGDLILNKSMDFNYYLNLFQKAANQLDKKLLAHKKVEAATGIYSDSVFLKLYKIAWANNSPYPLFSESRIFFSIWINDQAIKENKLLYNIHALKLRKLKGFSIASREFATAFRIKFNEVADQWPNPSMKFGPLTLMQGWQSVDTLNFEDEIVQLANRFLKVEYIIDDLLDNFKLR